MDRKQSERALARLERRLMEATAARDLDFLERHLGEEFTLTTGRPGAEVRARAEWLEETRDRYVIESFEFLEMDVRTYGHVAVVASRLRQQGRIEELDRSTDYLMTDVWVRRKGHWVLVARHASPLEAAART